LIIASELGTRKAAPMPCERAQQGRDGEGHQAHPQHHEPAELVGDCPRDEDQRTERQQVTVNDPLLKCQSPTEFRGDRRQRQVHHRAVEERHE
jgi:hypothetical protein